MAWNMVVLWVVTQVVSAFLAPRPKPPPPAEITDKDIPLATQGEPMRVLFGHRWCHGANVVWYGDVRVVPIKKRGGKK